MVWRDPFPLPGVGQVKKFLRWLAPAAKNDQTDLFGRSCLAPWRWPQTQLLKAISVLLGRSLEGDLAFASRRMAPFACSGRLVPPPLYLCLRLEEAAPPFLCPGPIPYLQVLR